MLTQDFQHQESPLTFCIPKAMPAQQHGQRADRPGPPPKAKPAPVEPRSVEPPGD